MSKDAGLRSFKTVCDSKGDEIADDEAGEEGGWAVWSRVGCVADSWTGEATSPVLLDGNYSFIIFECTITLQWMMALPRDWDGGR
jgi:hypothetical protein